MAGNILNTEFDVDAPVQFYNNGPARYEALVSQIPIRRRVAQGALLKGWVEGVSFIYTFWASLCWRLSKPCGDFGGAMTAAVRFKTG